VLRKRLPVILQVLLLVFYSMLVLPAGGDPNDTGAAYSVAEAAYGSSSSSESDGRPVLLLKEVSYSPEIVQAGEEVTIKITLSNASNRAAKDVKVSITGLKSDEFIHSGASDVKHLKTLNGNLQTKLEFTIQASEKMTSGNYSIGIRADYSDDQQRSYTDEYNVFIRVEGREKGADVAINNIVVSPNEVGSNETFSLSFTVKNNGKTRAENIKVSVKGDEGIFSKSPDIKMIESLDPGKSHAAEFTFFAGDELQSKYYNIQISLEYEDQARDDAKVTVNQYAGVSVNGSNSKLIPKIIINSYRFEPVVVRAGERFSLEMSFLNTSSTRTVNNIKVYLTGIDSDEEGKIVFTPVGSSNTFFIDSIGPKGVSGQSMIMYTIPDAEPRTYTVTANLEYQDEDGKEYEATELIGIPVIQQSQLSAGEITLPPEAFIGEPVPISVEFYNTGKTKLGNLMVRVEGDFDVQQKQLYIGNFDSGAYDYFESSIIPTAAGALDGKLIFTYDDPSGEPQEYVREFTVNAVEAPPVDPAGQMPPEGMDQGRGFLKKVFTNKSFWGGLGVGIAAAAASGVVVAKRKRKRSIEFDEND